MTVPIVIFFLLITIISKEIIFVNEEVLVILSFLLFLTGAFLFAGESLSSTLDATSSDWKNKLEELSKAQINALEKAKKIREEALKVNEKVTPLYASILALLGKVDSLSEALLEEAEKQKLELKLKQLLLEEVEIESALVSRKAEVFFTKYIKADAVEGEFTQEIKLADVEASKFLTDIINISSNVLEDDSLGDLFFRVRVLEYAGISSLSEINGFVTRICFSLRLSSLVNLDSLTYFGFILFFNLKTARYRESVGL